MGRQGGGWFTQKVKLSCTAVWCTDLCCMTSKHWCGAWVLSVQSRLPWGGFCKGFVDTLTPVASCCLVPGQSCGAAVLLLLLLMLLLC